MEGPEEQPGRPRTTRGGEFRTGSTGFDVKRAKRPGAALPVPRRARTHLASGDLTRAGCGGETVQRTEAEELGRRRLGSQPTGNRRGSRPAAQRLATGRGSPRARLAEVGAVRCARPRTPGVKDATPGAATCQVQLEPLKLTPAQTPFHPGNLLPGGPETARAGGAGPGGKGLCEAGACLRPTSRTFPVCAYFRPQSLGRRFCVRVKA